MERNYLQYIVLAIGTIAFSVLLYYIVQQEKANPKLEKKEELVNYNQMTINVAEVYSEPDYQSSVKMQILPGTKVNTVSSTKYYFRIDRIEGDSNITDGYIAKKYLQLIKSNESKD